MSKFKTVCGVIAFVLFFLMLGAVGAIEQDIVPLFPGMVRVFALMALWVLFCNLAGAFDYIDTGTFDYWTKITLDVKFMAAAWYKAEQAPAEEAEKAEAPVAEPPTQTEG